MLGLQLIIHQLCVEKLILTEKKHLRHARQSSQVKVVGLFTESPIPQHVDIRVQILSSSIIISFTAIFAARGFHTEQEKQNYKSIS